jgi:hypothetical protein
LIQACVSATVGLMQERELDLLSLLSTLTCTRWFEWLVQPAREWSWYGNIR